MSTTFSKQVLLNAAAAVNPGNSFDLIRPHRTFTFEKLVAGGPATLVVNFEGSLDNLTWFQLATDATTAASVSFAVDKPCRYVRANLTTLTGGTAPTVTVNCLACE